MARPREFELDDAVERAMGVFWERGYEGTSLPDLLNGTGISRGSLYKAFGSKHALFMRTLALYRSRYIEPAYERLTDRATAGPDRIAAVFRGSLAALKAGDRRGCLLCTTAAGASHADEEIASAVREQLDQLRDGFAVALRDGGALDADEQARALALAYVGLRVMARGGGTAEGLDAGVSRILQDLSSSDAVQRTA